MLCTPGWVYDQVLSGRLPDFAERVHPDTPGWMVEELELLTKDRKRIAAQLRQLEELNPAMSDRYRASHKETLMKICGKVADLYAKCGVDRCPS